MKPLPSLIVPLLLASTFALAAPQKIPGIGDAMQSFVESNEISGAVTMVVSKDQILHLETTGFADLAARTPMQPDTIFWIKSMSKPVTGVAVMMLQDAGKLHVTDLVAKHLPEFADLKTPSGKPANLTIAHLLTHTSGLSEGLGESGGRGVDRAKTLSDLIPQYLSKPMLFEPGSQWKYCQSGINTASRIVELVSGLSFDEFLRQNLFEPLGMKDTTFYPSEAQLPRVVTLYSKNKDTGALDPAPLRRDILARDRPPLGNSGLYSTATDYARFCQMLLNGGSLDGRRYLKPETLQLMASNHTGDLKTGFTPGSVWGYACGITRNPEGVTAMLSPGTYGHGGAFGTQAWIDPAKGVAYILMIQRSNLNASYRNGDDNDIRKNFQQIAADALAKIPRT